MGRRTRTVNFIPCVLQHLSRKSWGCEDLADTIKHSLISIVMSHEVMALTRDIATILSSHSFLPAARAIFHLIDTRIKTDARSSHFCTTLTALESALAYFQ